MNFRTYSYMGGEEILSNKPQAKKELFEVIQQIPFSELLSRENSVRVMWRKRFLPDLQSNDWGTGWNKTKIANELGYNGDAIKDRIILESEWAYYARLFVDIDKFHIAIKETKKADVGVLVVPTLKLAKRSDSSPHGCVTFELVQKWLGNNYAQKLHPVPIFVVGIKDPSE